VTVNHAGQTVSGQVVEVSQGGIAILTVADLTVGEVVELQFKLRQNVLRLRAIIRNRKGARYGMEFLTLSPQQREHIVNWCRGMTHHIQARARRTSVPPRSLTEHRSLPACVMGY
jgi:c-di-GMP-binding flagellar brake protein YcgR